MKKIQDILKRKKLSAEGGGRYELDEKTIARVFLEAAKGEIRNLEDTDIREIKMKNNILYVKTAHPVVSSELFLRREKILDEIKKIIDKKTVDDIKIYSY